MGFQPLRQQVHPFFYTCFQCILFPSVSHSTFIPTHPRMVPYHASTTVGEWCGWWRRLVRVHAGWKYIFTRTLPLRSGNLEEFPEIQQTHQVQAADCV